MGELSIKIKIADREYPMKVNAEEEERIRRTAKLINEKLKAYRDQFGIDDKQDLLAMVAFDSLVEKLQSDESKTTNFEMVFNKVRQLNEILSQST